MYVIGKDMHDFCVELLIMHDAYEEDWMVKGHDVFSDLTWIGTLGLSYEKRWC